MSVLKRGNSKFWYIQFQFQGKTYIKSSKTTDKRIAERIEREWKVLIHSQQYLGEKESISFKDIMIQYIETKENTPNHVTLVSRCRILTKYFPINRKLHELSNNDINNFLKIRIKQSVTNQTIKKDFDLIRGSWKYGKKLGYQYSDIEFPTLKMEKHRLRYLSLDEEKRLLSELNPYREDTGTVLSSKRPTQIKQDMIDVYDLVIILIDTGARYSEISKIGWDSINLTDKTIRLWRPKVRNESVLYMSDRVYSVLTNRFKNKSSSYVFTNRKGGPRNTATLPIRKGFKRSGIIGCTVHTFRHTHATRLIQNGLSLYEVKEILGHTDINTTMRYAHLERKDISYKAKEVINKLNINSNKPDLKII